MFCSALQFKIRYALLNEVMEDVLKWKKESDFLMSNDQPAQQRTIFKAKAKAFYFVRAPGIYHSD